jgi:oligoendopeptidase F
MKISEIQYKRVDPKEVKKKLAEAINGLKNAKSADELKQLIDRFDEESGIIMSMGSLAYMRNSLNVNDAFYAAEKEFYAKMGAKLGMKFLKFNKTLLKSPHLEELKKKYVAPIAFENMEMDNKCISLRTIPLLIKDNKLCTRYFKLMGNIKFEIDGVSYNSSSINKLLVSSDREVRRRAAEESGKKLLSVREELDTIFDELVKSRAKEGEAA